MVLHFEHKYSIGEKLYHITPDSDMCVVLNISYDVRHDEVSYEVVYGFNSTNVWCIEAELTKTKVFA